MDLKKHITDWFAAMDAHDYAKIATLLEPKHKFTNTMTPEPIGAEEHVGMIKMMHAAWTGKHILDVVVNDGHEWVCVRGRWSGKHTGEFNGVPATGKNVEFSWIDMQRVVNGKIVDEYMELNPMSIMQQIGAAPVNA